MKIKSIFEQISEKVFTMRNLGEAQKFIVDFVNEKKINEKDKQSIITNTLNAKSIQRLQTYLCNSLLKYEGMGVNQ
jgi:hypothetical protein